MPNSHEEFLIIKAPFFKKKKKTDSISRKAKISAEIALFSICLQ